MVFFTVFTPCPSPVSKFCFVPLQCRPDLVEPGRMEELMVFFTVFLGSPAYIKNPYLR